VILGLETSTDWCGIALVEAGQCIGWEEREAPRAHSSVLLPMVEHLLKRWRIAPERLQAIAVSQGPGAFTGLRVGMSLAKGLAVGWGKPVIGVSTLRVVADQTLSSDGCVSVIDAKRGRVYSAAYLWCEGEWQEVKSPACETPEALAEWVGGRRVTASGSGLSIAHLALQRCPGVTLAPEEQWRPRAWTVAKLGEVAFQRGEIPNLASLAPVYLQDPSIRPSALRPPLPRKGEERRGI